MNPFRRFIYGKKWAQPLFEKMYTISIGGMNFGNVDLHVNGELHVLDHLQATEKDPIIFDVGANHGQYLTAVMERFGNRVQVHSFEPSPAAFAGMQQKFPGAKNVVLNNTGLGATDNAEETLYCHTPGGSGSSIFRKDLPDSAAQYNLTEQIRLRTLDSYVKEHNIPSITLLKVDVEGYEMEVFRGARNTLDAGKIKYIQFEFGEGTVGAQTYFRDFYELLSPRYTICRVLRNGWRPVGRYSLSLEQFNTVNYLAIRKG